MNSSPSTPRQSLRRLRLDADAGVELGRAVLDIGKGHAEILMDVIAEALGAAGIAFAGLGAVAVSVGPGSFTGVRVGVSAARGLALALKIPAVGVSTLEALAAETRVVSRRQTGSDGSRWRPRRNLCSHLR